MDNRLSQAVAAARSGQKEEAQQLLAELLEENPDEAQGWFLLSNLVDNPEQKQVFLGRTLALDPDHALAQTQWQKMHGADAATIAVSAGDDFVEQAEGDSLPDWMADDAEHLRLDEREVVAEAETTAVSPDEPVPDWLAEEVDLETKAEPVAVDGETAVAPPSAKPTPTKEAPASKHQPSSQERRLTLLLYVLSGIAVLVFLALIFLVVTNL